ncbi:uncharacterized protein LOC122614409 [Drosophila teissieri]|uniref:uncharacterized protein LOC122614409 n=1 Tax=Drosophila teissieri TaxID=7243 RepID=UPI001CBA44BA|nr:uncharacterized protein LOC122614409 [Drosophila teissieri]
MPHPALFQEALLFVLRSGLRSGQRAKQICQCLNNKQFSPLKADINIYSAFRLREPQLFATRPLRVRHLQSAQSWPKVLVERVGRQLLSGYLLLYSRVCGPIRLPVRGPTIQTDADFWPSIFKRIRFTENRVIKFWFKAVGSFALH